MERLPKAYQLFRSRYPRVLEAHQKLAEACHQAGPLDQKTRELVKLGIAVGAQHEGAVHAHIRFALAAGATADEIRHAVVLGTSTIGFPSTTAALTWTEDLLGARRGKS